MIDPKMEEALNRQVNAELYSAYLYLAMSADCDDKGLAGFAQWFYAQAQEELYHARKMYAYVIERGGRAELYAIDQPQKEWASALAAFEAALGHERKVTGLINGLMDLAIELKDHATRGFLQWYVDEQVEEEASAGEMVSKLKLVGGEGQGLFTLDREAGQRPPLFLFPAEQQGA